MPVWRHNVDLFTNFFGNGVSKEKPKSCAFEVMLVRNEKKNKQFPTTICGAELRGWSRCAGCDRSNDVVHVGVEALLDSVRSPLIPLNLAVLPFLFAKDAKLMLSKKTSTYDFSHSTFTRFNLLFFKIACKEIRLGPNWSCVKC